MTNYTKATNFATKDALSSGNPLKIVKGTEIDTEFNNIATAIATKADLATTTIATTAFVQAAIALLYPVGSIYTNASVSTNPATLLGFGTWTAFGAGRVMVGFDSGNALFDTAEETGGSADAIVPSHTHTATSTVTDPSHNHSYTQPSPGSLVANINGTGAGAISGTTGSAFTGITVATSISTAGVSVTNANYQPYITVYMWKRTV